VTLTIPSDEVGSLPPPDRGSATFRPNARAGRLARMLGRGWKRE
jgi:hypothetical protein